MIDQRKRMRTWLIRAHHQGLETPVPGSGSWNSQLLLDQTLRSHRMGTSLKRK